MKSMTKYEAFIHAHNYWSGKGLPFVRIKRKSSADRFEVGYHPAGVGAPVILGSGPSWEVAFDRALKGSTK